METHGLASMPINAWKLVDSVAELGPSDRGCVAVTGSHGGLSAARYAAVVRPALCVFNDAGVGRDRAGIAGLPWLDALGLPACAVSHESACIGQAQSTLEHGVVSHVNQAARALGLEVGQALQPQLRRIAPCMDT